jgi:hypothetical protein
MVATALLVFVADAMNTVHICDGDGADDDENDVVGVKLMHHHQPRQRRSILFA